ncbi:MAG TPA: hypothetical protein VKV74_07830, partial [Bryobacteraceae bacterium]|nr:hypothetical protein [Bryobacteraceae bacterium]
MTRGFRLYWLRENGCDAGLRVRAEDLDPAIRQRALELAAGDLNEIKIYLPFLDKREWARRDQILRSLTLERRGDSIVYSLPVPAALRDRAATLALAHPAWTAAPDECEPRYFPVWQDVSLALQSFLRRSIAEECFRDVQRFEDREGAYSMLVYAVARLFYGREPSEFTYDLRDYPENQATLAASWKLTGQPLQRALAEVEQRLYRAGMPALARRYAPIWYEDVMVAVRKRPRRYVDLLAKESAFINAVIDLGTQRSIAAV